LATGFVAATYFLNVKISSKETPSQTTLTHPTIIVGNSPIKWLITPMARSKIWRMKDETIVNHVIDDLHDLKIINKKDVCFAKTKRTEYAYVINDLNHDKNMQTIRKYTKKTGIDLVGRFAEFEYMNMDACIRSAMTYAKRFDSAREHLLV
jgi:protoporphyrinogen oxidase